MIEILVLFYFNTIELADLPILSIDSLIPIQLKVHSVISQALLLGLHSSELERQLTSFSVHLDSTEVFRFLLHLKRPKSVITLFSNPD